MAKENSNRDYQERLVRQNNKRERREKMVRETGKMSIAKKNRIAR